MQWLLIKKRAKKQLKNHDTFWDSFHITLLKQDLSHVEIICKATGKFIAERQLSKVTLCLLNSIPFKTLYNGVHPIYTLSAFPAHNAL